MQDIEPKREKERERVRGKGKNKLLCARDREADGLNNLHTYMVINAGDYYRTL